jgi:hypothetical protein
MHTLDCRMWKFLIILEACDLIILRVCVCVVCHLQNHDTFTRDEEASFQMG